jgi:hypothetical protein
MEHNGKWWRGVCIEILEKEIELAEQQMQYNIAMKPIIKYLQIRLDELRSEAE